MRKPIATRRLTTAALAGALSVCFINVAQAQSLQSTLRLVSETPYAAPQAAVCWSSALAPQIKTDVSVGPFFGRGSGESVQLAFHGPGFVVVQPAENAVYSATTS